MILTLPQVLDIFDNLDLMRRTMIITDAATTLRVSEEETPYPTDEDLIFPSLRLKGKKPPAANMLVSDYLRVAAEKAGVIAAPRTFGFHTFRRTLASVLVRMKVNVKTVQEILRHQNLKTTLEIYAKAMSEDKLQAQGMFLEELFSQDKKNSAQAAISTKDLENIEPAVRSLQ